MRAVTGSHGQECSRGKAGLQAKVPPPPRFFASGGDGLRLCNILTTSAAPAPAFQPVAARVGNKLPTLPGCATDGGFCARGVCVRAML